MDSWKSFRHKVELARQLAGRDWLVLAEAWWILLGFHLALRWVSLNRLETFTHLALVKKTAPPQALTWAHHRQILVSMASRLHVPSMSCLPQALTLYWMASRHAIPAQLRIGMNKTSNGIYAHAWVELEGEAIGEPEDINKRFNILRNTG